MAVISGTVKDVNGDFARRVVRAYRRSDGAFASQAVSDATTGAFSCAALDTSAHYALTLDGDVPEFDPYWSNVVIAMHMDGADASTTFVDEKGHAVTVYGGAKLSTTSPARGTACAVFGGTGDYLSFGDPADLELGGGSFTIEFWLKTTQTLVYACPIGRDTGTFPAGAWLILLNGPGSGYIQFWNASYSTSAAQLSPASNPAINDGAWHHVAIVRNGSAMALYKDGTSIATATWTGSIADLAAGVNIGRYQGYSRDFNGSIDDLRITKGVARYTANFTPPAAAFPHGLSIGAPTTNALIFDNITPV